LFFNLNLLFLLAFSFFSFSVDNSDNLLSFCTTMSSHDNEELIDYEDEHDVIPNGTAPAAPTNGAAASAADGEVDKDKKNYSGIHSTGFRFVLPPRCYKLWSSDNLSPFFSQGLLVES
jgi:hypothetical protein